MKKFLVNLKDKIGNIFSFFKSENEDVLKLKNELKIAKLYKDKDLQKVLKKEIKSAESNFFSRKQKNLKYRKIKDSLLIGNSIFYTIFVFVILIWIIVYVFTNGSKYLSWDFITGEYQSTTLTLVTKSDFNYDDLLDFSDIDLNNEGVSKKWGVIFTYTESETSSTNEITVSEISENSPFKTSLVKYGESEVINLAEYNAKIYSITGYSSNNEMISATNSDSLEDFITKLDSINNIIDSSFVIEGGGIRSPLLTTLALIGVTLLIAMPLGIGGAIYLGVYAKNNKITILIRSLIDMISGIPSIVFGLAGALIFIPFTSLLTGSGGKGNLLSGALTMSLILLPTIVKTVEESIKVIPKNLVDASLALGTSKSETIFKVIIPNSIGGILTSLLLSIGRIIGESAALVFAMGTAVSNFASISANNATLAVHIWVILGGDHPSYDSACAISFIIILIIMILSITIKLVVHKFNRFKR